MSNQIPLAAALCLVIGAVIGFSVAILRGRRRIDQDDKVIKDQQLQIVTLQQESQSLLARHTEIQEHIERSEGQRRIADESKTSRIRDIELELERLKMMNAGHLETDSKFRQSEAANKNLQERLQEALSQSQLLEARLSDSMGSQQTVKQDLERRLMENQTELKNRDQRILEQERRITQLQHDVEARNEQYHQQVSSLVQAREDLNAEKARIREEEEHERSEALEKRRLNWINHEKSVEESLKTLCKRMEIIYHDKRSFPLARKPDCAIEVGGQFVILDAKAPADPESPEAFYDYLKKQAEQMEKYLKQEGVRKEAFLVVPTDALPYLQERFYFEIASFRIYVIAVEALEPALRLYRKIEEYEILQTLGPEAQDEIASFIGQASRMIKRRVQIDHFMSEKFIELLMSGDALPEEILKKSQSKEKNFVLNTPRLDRGKNLPTDDLKKKQNQLSFHIEGMDINAKLGSDALEGIPLERLTSPASSPSEPGKEPDPHSSKKFG